MKYYIARDEDGSLWLYDIKPKKEKNLGWWDISTRFIELDSNSYLEVKWTDEEATEVEIILNLKK